MASARGRMRSKNVLGVCALVASGALLTCFGVLSSGCRDEAKSGSSGAPTATHKSAVSALPTPAHVATLVPTAATRPPKQQLVDLLHTVASTVVVSSKVQNPRDYPEHLVDGKVDTAWNGKTGNLVGGFIEFEVPKETHVRRIELTPGYSHVGKNGDLFTMNHRISRVRVTREGQPLGEFSLDTNQRMIQPLAVDAPGGKFRVEVLAVEPGSKKEWRELVVSEFRVWGERNQAPENPTHLPLVYVGAVGGAPPPPKGRDGAPTGPFASLDDMCAKYNAALKDPLKKYWGSGERYPGEIGPHCVVWELSSPPMAGLTAASIPKSSPYLDVQFYNAHSVHEDFIALAVKTPRGWFRTDSRTTERAHNDPGCLRADFSVFRGVSIEPASDGSSVLLFQYVEHVASWGGVPGDDGGILDDEKLIWCRATPDGALTCDRGQVIAHREYPLPDGFDPGSVGSFAFDPNVPAWTWRKRPMLTPTGEVRLIDEK